MSLPPTAPLSLVEGLGDEVLLFLFTLLLGGLLLLVWGSTAVRERPRVEAVLIQPVGQGVIVAERIDGTRSDASGAQPNESNVIWADEGRTAETADDAEQATRRQDHRECDRPHEETTAVAEQSTEADETRPEASTSGETAESRSEPEAATPDVSSPSSLVRIKLKFLNDTQREVRAALSEPLGRFKRRNFAAETTDNKTVRLIFNGHVLNQDQETLSHYGLFDNCVVHCLVSNVQQQQSQRSQGQIQHSPDDGLDLSHMAYPLLGSILLIIWWTQLIFPQFFSITSTMSLV